MIRGPCHYGRDSMLQRLGEIKQRHPLVMLRFRVDPAVFPVGRAMIGIYHALKHLDVEGDLSPLARELAASQGPAPR